MATIPVKIADSNMPRIKTGYFKVFPNNETMPDPAWVDDGGSPDMIAKYTDLKWFQETLRRFIVHNTLRGEAAIAKETADALSSDIDSMVT